MNTCLRVMAAYIIINITYNDLSTFHYPVSITQVLKYLNLGWIIGVCVKKNKKSLNNVKLQTALALVPRGNKDISHIPSRPPNITKMT
jgi:hypothetical protein